MSDISALGSLLGISPPELTFTYTNWRGETALRRVGAHSARFVYQTTEHHPGEPQWMLTAIDLDRGAVRDFAVRDIVSFGPALRKKIAPAMRCDGCGSTWSDERLREEKTKDPHIISCCPERKMVPNADPRFHVQFSYSTYAEGIVKAVHATAARVREADDAIHVSIYRDGEATAAEEGQLSDYFPACEICGDHFIEGDTLAMDIEMGAVHAVCLEDAPVVNLETGEPIEGGTLSTFPCELGLPAVGVRALQGRVREWTLECFGDEIACDMVERMDRFVEEALELVQALRYTPDRAHALVDYVFGREAGEPGQEVGGTMTTLAALCNVAGIDIEASFQAEVDRITTPEMVEKIRAKQAAKPTGSALPVAFGNDLRAQRDTIEEAFLAVCKELKCEPDNEAALIAAHGLREALHDLLTRPTDPAARQRARAALGVDARETAR